MEKYVCKASLVPRALLFSGQFDFRIAQKHYIMNDAVEASFYEMTTIYYTKIDAHFLKIGLKCSFGLNKNFVLFCFLEQIHCKQKKNS